MEASGENSASGNGSGSSESEGDEQDEPSSIKEASIEDVLATFRAKWQKEISSPKRQVSIVSEKRISESDNDARLLFLKGVEMERVGELYQAIQFYRKAVQIDPDIEFKIDAGPKQKIRDRKESTQSEIETTDYNDSEESDSDNEIIEEGQLLPRIQKKMSRFSSLCSQKFDQSATHISVLPFEVILQILRWAVSVDLDLRTLETFGKVCRGYYLCSRDPEIWRLACLRAWGLNCGPTPGIYGSWRNMFIERARLNFNGCYISKTTYIRHGENSFQDQFYRPWHIVAYYRYLRFFPEGVVLMLTSSDEPPLCVGQMKNRNARQPVMVGYYRLKDDIVTLVIQRQEHKIIGGIKNKPMRNKRELHEGAEQTLHIELQIKNYKGKKHCQLVWTHYSVFTRTKRGDESTCNFDLVTNRFPPLWFSRVKSYTQESEMPLT